MTDHWNRRPCLRTSSNFFEGRQRPPAQTHAVRFGLLLNVRPKPVGHQKRVPGVMVFHPSEKGLVGGGTDPESEQARVEFFVENVEGPSYAQLPTLRPDVKPGDPGRVDDLRDASGRPAQGPSGLRGLPGPGGQMLDDDGVGVWNKFPDAFGHVDFMPEIPTGSQPPLVRPVQDRRTGQSRVDSQDAQVLPFACDPQVSLRPLFQGVLQFHR